MGGRERGHCAGCRGRVYPRGRDQGSRPAARARGPGSVGDPEAKAGAPRRASRPDRPYLANESVGGALTRIVAFRQRAAGTLHGAGCASTGSTFTRVARAHIDGTPRMNVTKPSIGDRTSPVLRPRKSVVYPRS